MDDFYNKKFLDLKKKSREEEILQAELIDKKNRLNRKINEMYSAAAVVKKEGEDVRQIEGLSVVAIFSKILGTQKEKIEKEKNEYLLATLKYNESKEAVTELKQRIDQIISEIKLLGDPTSEYRNLLKEKEQFMISTNDLSSKELVEISEKLMDNECKFRELRNVKDIGKVILQNFDKILDQLKAAENYAIWDVHGGGVTSDLYKHEKIENAKTLVNRTQYLLNDFQKILYDLEVDIDLSGIIPIGSFSTFADLFLGGLLWDLIVYNKIDEAKYNIQLKKNHIFSIVNSLQGEIDFLNRQRSILENDRQDIIKSR